MTPEEARKKFIEARDALDKSRVGPDVVADPAAQAFVGGTKPGPAVDELPDLSAGPKQDLIGMGLDVAGGMIGESKAVRVLDKLPIPEKYKLPAEIGARVLGGSVGAGTTDLTWQNLRRLTGAEGAPDNFKESALMSAKAATDQGIAGIYGFGLGKAGEAMGARTKAVDPDRLDQMNEMRDRLKAVYEKIGGKPLVEDMSQRWGIMKRLRPLETELDDHVVTQRLKDAGLDPQTARKVALQGGLTTGELVDNVPYSILQSVAESSFASKKYMENYKGTRGQMYRSMIDDISSEFGSALPEEHVGKAIANAINGNYNLDNAVITHGLTEVQRRLEPDFAFNTKGIKGSIRMRGFDPEGPARLILGDVIPDSGPGGPAALMPGSSATRAAPAPTTGPYAKKSNNQMTFDQVMQARASLSTIAHDEGADPQHRADSQKLLKTLDKAVQKQLPGGLEQYYGDVTAADDQLNRDGFRTQFTQGLLGTNEGYRKYAQYLLKNGDVGNFDKMAKAAGPDATNNVKRSIADIVTQNAVGPDGTMNPASLDKMMNEHGKYGRHFLESTLGPQWTSNVDRLQKSMEIITSSGRHSLTDLGLNAIRYAPVAKLLYDGFHGTVDPTTVGLAAAMITSPRLVARVLTSPKATANIERLAGLAVSGKNPHTFARLTARTAEAIGATPEELASMTGNPAMTALQKARRDLGAGKLPSTGSPMADVMLNPAGALAQVGSQQIPGQ
jgi:hypothetical protein